MGANVTSYMVLRSEGTYEIYELTNALRSRGTYVFEPGNAGMPGSLGVVRWKSGLNYDLGRGGSYFTSNPGFNCQHCIVMGRNAVAVLDK
jgi:hypothetical protein